LRESWSTEIKRAIVVIGLLWGVWLVPACANAHPLGNFTINHLARISSQRAQLDVRYFLDIAEIPTFQIMQSHSDLRAWAQDEIAVVQAGFHLSVDGKPQQLIAGGATSRLRPGAGGLPILYWVADFQLPLQPGVRHEIRVDDEVYADRRIGWKDIVAGTQTEPTDELQHYPSALIGTPRRIGSAVIALDAAGRIAHVVDGVDTTPVIASTTSWLRPTLLSEMFSRPDQQAWFVALTILAAFGLGALHAAEPGHGKALLAFTLVGARATGKQALILAGSLTFAHTIGVLLLGVALFFVGGFVSETIYPWITLISGAAIAVIGARTLARFVRTRRGHSHAHVHSHAGAQPHAHTHDHDGAHDAAHGHAHAVPGNAPIKFGSAIWAAMSGGIAPCPAAIVVLLAALRLHHLAYGLLLIVVFSLGLATVLSGLGIGVVHGASWLSRRSNLSRFLPYGPLCSALVIATIGAVMLAQGLSQQGVTAPVPLLAGIALAAIGGYALTASGHHHVHALSETEPSAA